MNAHSSEEPAVRKPHPNFPLFPHNQTNRWAKKVRGKRHYFGPIAGDEDGQAALNRWREQKDDLLAGRTPRVKTDSLTLAELCNKFLTAKRGDVDAGKLSPRTFVEYSRTLELLVNTFGRDRGVLDLRPDDFEQLYAKLAKKHGLTTLGREVTMVRSVFKYAVESDLIERAVKFGPRFKSPSKADRRKHKARQKHVHGSKAFTSTEVKSASSKQLLLKHDYRETKYLAENKSEIV